MSTNPIVALVVTLLTAFSLTAAPIPGTLGVETSDSCQGATVIRTVRLGAAEKAGLLRLDVILRVNGENIKNSAELREYLSGCKAGDPLDLVVLRNGREEKLRAVLTPRAALTKTEPGEFPESVRKKLRDFCATSDEIAYILSEKEPYMKHLRSLMKSYAERHKQRNIYLCFRDIYGCISLWGAENGIFLTVHRAAGDDNYRIDAAQSVTPLPDGVRRRLHDIATR